MQTIDRIFLFVIRWSRLDIQIIVVSEAYALAYFEPNYKEHLISRMNGSLLLWSCLLPGGKKFVTLWHFRLFVVIIVQL